MFVRQHMHRLTWRNLGSPTKSTPQMPRVGHLHHPAVSYRCYTGGASSDDFLHKSIVPTDHFQKSLPRLPVPDLPKTCERYLSAQRPLLSEERFKQTEKIVANFRDGDGKDLQNELVQQDKQNKNTSYISAPWSDMYLKGRMSVVLNHNPFIAFNDDPRPGYNDQLIRATNLVVSSLRFMKTLRSNILEPEIFHLDPGKSDTMKFRKFVRWLPKSVSWYGAYWYKAFPLDMSQYSKLFNTTRIPRLVKDEIFTDTSARHLLVIRRGNFYVVDVLDKDGNIMAGEEIQTHLKYIMDDQSPQPDHPLGVLTTADRDTWANLRQQLEAAGNGEKLRLIDSALFALALDDTGPQDVRQISKSFLHSDGVNRWFDKSFSLILDKNGKACVTFEHSWGDGVAVLRYFNEIFADTRTHPRISPDSRPAPVDSASAVHKLEFTLSSGVKEGIRQVKDEFSKRTDSIMLNYIEYGRFGKNFLKKQRLSPDGMMQLAIQLAYYKQYGQTVATYESASTAAFKHGRTETIRSATMATKNACKMLGQSETMASASEIRTALGECSKVHGQLTKDAAMGQGFDRHLFVLRYLAEASGQLPELYTDQAYKDINHVILSTSTLSSPAVFIGGFGPVVPNGFGIGYGVADDAMGCIVTGYKGNQNVDEFLECMQEGLDDIHRVLQETEV